MASKKTQAAAKTLNETTIKVGKALARSTHQMEQTGRKLKKAAEKLVKEAGHRVEETVEETVDVIKKEVKSLTKKKESAPANPLLFHPGRGMTVEGQMGFLAGDIYHYLCDHGTVTVEKLHKQLAKRHPAALIFAALGWLTREAKIRFSDDGQTVSLLENT
ncbi:MAG: winged helix-turn-helix domain-containing protein [Thermodesulfobacteriota bacterium]